MSGRTQRGLDQAAASDLVEIGESKKSSCGLNLVEINADEKLVVVAPEKKLEDLV